MTPLAAALALAGGLLLAGTATAGTLPSGFRDTVVLSGLVEPTAVRFGGDGRVFVAEKSGVIKVFDTLEDLTPTVFADLNANVYDFWDRGLLGLALAPDFPTDPHVYVLYAYDAPPGGTAPTWGTPGVYGDPCPDPLGFGCVVSGRLSRLTADGDHMTGQEEPLLADWCQQFPSHSVGDLAFGPDGDLYVSAGDGASFDYADYGQLGNACFDPYLQGGSLRAQDLGATADPTGLDGALLRLDPATAGPAEGNPLASAADLNARRILAEGLRNPFRFTIRPGTGELWIGDVGWNNWDEIDRTQAPTAFSNFGWPCFEGAGRQPVFEGLGLPACQSLYDDQAAATPPYFSYHRGMPVVPGEDCPNSRSAISGLAFYDGRSYPVQYHGALFFGDYERRCIWAMLAGSDGLPDPSSVVLVEAGVAPVDLEAGPGGDLFFVDLDGGAVHRISYSPPTAVGFVGGDARATRGGVLVRWAVGSAPRTLGFNVYRGWSSPRTRLNSQLIQSNSFLDRRATAGAYWIEEVALDGRATMHGPVPVR